MLTAEQARKEMNGRAARKLHKRRLNDCIKDICKQIKKEALNGKTVLYPRLNCNCAQKEVANKFLQLGYKVEILNAIDMRISWEETK